MVVAILFISSARFLGYFLSPVIAERMSRFVLEGVYFSPIILVLVSAREVLLRNKFDFLSRIGVFSLRWKEILQGWIIIPISSVSAIFVEFLILAKYSENTVLWILLGPLFIILALVAGGLVRAENIEDMEDVKKLYSDIFEDFEKMLNQLT